MKFDKPAFNIDQQVDVLLNRGMTGDRALMTARLRSVSYFRLCGYTYPFRKTDPSNPRTLLDEFRPNTSFDEVWNRYAFDRHLRLLVMDAIERIEVAVRSQLANIHSSTHGVFAYATDAATLPNIRAAQRHRFLADLADQFAGSKEPFVEHFRIKYGDSHSYPPVWMACEVMTFGATLTFPRGCHHQIRREIAGGFGVDESVLDSWLLSLNTVRNICAHHSRLWNREIGTKPKIPNKDIRWHDPVKVGNQRVFGILTICKHCLDRIAPQSGWANRVRALLADSPHIPIGQMGFPADWHDCPIWT
jgi:abortive infection bacteriophage resistance protein